MGWHCCGEVCPPPWLPSDQRPQPCWPATPQGFFPRAWELAKLGGTFFLGFLPFILAVSLGFGAVYLAFGDSFVHGGRPSAGPPVYYDPDALLAEPTADPMVPLELR